MIEFCVLRPKMNAYLIDSYNDDDYEKKDVNKNLKAAKKCV